jgi:hypothetical protein
MYIYIYEIQENIERKERRRKVKQSVIFSKWKLHNSEHDSSFLSFFFNVRKYTVELIIMMRVKDEGKEEIFAFNFTISSRFSLSYIFFYFHFISTRSHHHENRLLNNNVDSYIAQLNLYNCRRCSLSLFFTHHTISLLFISYMKSWVDVQ